MLKIIKNRTPVECKEYNIEFRYKDDPDAGFWFPATSIGAPELSKMSPEMLANYKACLTDERLIQEEFEPRTYTYIEPAVGKCSCGREVVLECDYNGAVRCECGQWYNLFGQSLVDPQYWTEDDDDWG